ncbi:hypothetical protein C8A01DRAFT_16348 [Parachaetomium inaequale]|uniref:Uncharacterized protein n=1 Tax=Parachaetomium inaequale TaxID=2588326 RepID=A0AAN6PIM6_9PEZI|nr:hypothetical protein C8A01DRAFT_16348 [Parachaetomium inaequale]
MEDQHRSHPKQNTSTAASELPQPWTATRCHRLLRPLLAHIAALRKDKERRSLGQGAAAQGQTTKPRRTVLGKRSYPADDSDYSDKKTCRKYSRKASRRKSSGDQSCTPQRNVQRLRRQPDNKAPQDVVLPTPFLRRVRNHQLSSPARAPYEPHQEEPAPTNGRCTHSGSGCKTKCAFELELAGLRPTMGSERHGLYESVFKAFDALLRATSPRKNQAAGPKSLLAMCLRKVPAYIAGLEEWERQESEEKGTKLAVQGAGVSFEVYSELESLGAVDGWSNLCLLVRAHAVQIIQDAASEGLLEDPVTSLLIRVCLEYMRPMEFIGLIETFVVRQYPKPCSADDDLFTSPALQPLRALMSCDPSGTLIQPRILAHLLADDLLPPDWILNKSFIALWPSTVRHVTHMKPCQDILDFIITTLELLCSLASPRKPRGVPQTRLRGKPQTTLISAVAALGSVVLLSEEGSTETPSTSSPTRAATLRRRINHITTTCSTRLKTRKSPSRKLGTYLLALCSFLSLSQEEEEDPSPTEPSTATATVTSIIETSWQNVQNCRDNPALMLQYDATTALMSAMAHHCSRGTGHPPQAYLARFCDGLEALALPRGALGSMRVDGAFRLAEQTGDLRDLAFAEGLRGREGTGVGGCVTPARGGGKGGRGRKVTSFSGIRWDDGISEWVAATPGTEVRRPTETNEVGPELSPADDESDSDAPMSVSETDNEEEEEEEEDTPSPNTEASPVSASDPESETDSESESEAAPSPEPPHPETKDSHPPGKLEPTPRINDTQSHSSPPAPEPTPAGGFLAARPRRLLPRPITITRAGDELAFDTQQSTAISEKEEKEEKWLSKKKPARFRLSSGGTATAGVRKRVARASLVYLQPRIGAGVAGGEGRRRSEGWVNREYGDGDSDDELSLL